MIRVVKLEIGEWAGPLEEVPAKMLGEFYTIEAGDERVAQDVENEKIYHSDFEKVPGFIDTYEYTRHREALAEERVRVRYVMVDMGSGDDLSIFSGIAG